MLFLWSLYLSINPEITVSTKVLSSMTVFNIDNIECFLSSSSEGSCDTEDWSNDAENSALKSHEFIFKYIQIESKL